MPKSPNGYWKLFNESTKVQKTEEITFQQTNFHRQNSETQKKSVDTCSFEKYALPLQPLIYIQNFIRNVFNCRKERRNLRQVREVEY